MAAQQEQAKVGGVKHWRLEKRVDATGEIFEVLEGGDGKPTRCLLRRPGQPAASYSSHPLEESKGHES